jgi:hypothetical protein
MTTETFTLTGYEAVARRLFDSIPKKEYDDSFELRMARQVFEVKYRCSLSLDSINKLGGALSFLNEPLALEEAVERLKKLRVLRSRKYRSVMLYEVNY